MSVGGSPNIKRSASSSGRGLPECGVGEVWTAAPSSGIGSSNPAAGSVSTCCVPVSVQAVRKSAVSSIKIRKKHLDFMRFTFRNKMEADPVVKMISRNYYKRINWTIRSNETLGVAMERRFSRVFLPAPRKPGQMIIKFFEWVFFLLLVKIFHW